MAQKEFPDKLANVARDRIYFTIQASMNGARRTVRVSESAWTSTVSRMLRGEVLDIQLQDEKPSADAPPQYLDVPKLQDAEERKSRSAPSSPPSSRRSSPSGARRERSISRWGFGRF